MATISAIRAFEFLDSRGFPTVGAQVITSNQEVGFAMVPSGASTGEHEALELRDKDPTRFSGKGVQKAISNIIHIIAPKLIGLEITNQRLIDQTMIELDGTAYKTNLGANSILAVSMACAQAAAKSKGLALYQYLSNQQAKLLPCPMMNILNGGAHADNPLDFQEFMIRPIGAKSFSQAMQWGCEIYHVLKSKLKEQGLSISVGDEGGFAPLIETPEQALDLMSHSVEKLGLKLGTDITFAMDCAASELYDAQLNLYKEKKRIQRIGNGSVRSSQQQADYLVKLTQQYPIDSIEDGLDQNDWQGWKYLTDQLKNSCQIVGDDLFVTQSKFLQKGIDMGVSNAILIKLNQVGTVSETLDTIHLAQKNGFKTIISHRSGETEDTFIADLAVAVGCGQIKTGAPCRSDRIAKYNRLLMIENELGRSAFYTVSGL